MKVELKLARHILERHLKETSSNRGLTDSIRIHQVADPVDMTQQAADRDVAVQILDRESVLARRIRSALDRIQDGSYGICLQCEEEIAPKRLKAMPWAELCIACQERADKYASQNRGRTPASEDWTEAA